MAKKKPKITGTVHGVVICHNCMTQMRYNTVLSTGKMMRCPKCNKVITAVE